MPTRDGHARWEGSLKDGSGTMRTGSGSVEGSFSAASRFEDGSGTNPEEILGAAHAGCFSMALSQVLGGAGYQPEYVETTAHVAIEQQGDGFAIAAIKLDTQASVPGLAPADFQQHAEAASRDCPVSKALGGVVITLDATLVT
jgi:lipoyl-dependent peroxiredoxin